SRSVVIRMRRRAPAEHIEPFRNRLHAPEGRAIGEQIALWARSVPKEICWPDLPVDIQDRNADVWEPLVAVADLVGGELPARSRAAAVAMVTDASDREPSLGVRLLADLRQVFGDAREMSTKDILAALHELPEAPWADLKGKPLDERGLAVRLRQFSV